MTAQTQATPDAFEIPDALKRTEKPAAQAATPAPAAVEQTPAPAPKKPNRAERRAAAKAAKASAPKADKPAKTAKVKAAPKHKPSDIVSTEANPAKSIVPVKFKEKYADHDGSCGDKLAYSVKSFLETKNADGRTVLSMERLAELASDNGIDFGKYKHLNNGQQSMNVRNRLRGLLKAGKKVRVGKQVFADAEKALAVQPVAA